MVGVGVACGRGRRCARVGDRGSRAADVFRALVLVGSAAVEVAEVPALTSADQLAAAGAADGPRRHDRRELAPEPAMGRAVALLALREVPLGGV